MSHWNGTHEAKRTILIVILIFSLPLGILYWLGVHHSRQAVWRTPICAYGTTNTPSPPRSLDPLPSSYKNFLAKDRKTGHDWTAFWMTSSSLVGFSRARSPLYAALHRPNSRPWKTETPQVIQWRKRRRTDCITSRKLIQLWKMRCRKWVYEIVNYLLKTRRNNMKVVSKIRIIMKRNFLMKKVIIDLYALNRLNNNVIMRVCQKTQKTLNFAPFILDSDINVSKSLKSLS